MIEEFCKFIEDHTTLVRGSTLQVGHRVPNAPDNCAVVLESGGGVPNNYSRSVNMVDKMIQITTRGKTFFIARDMAYEIFDFLKGQAGWNLPDLSGIKYLAMVINAITDPQWIGLDKKGRFEFSTNYMVMYEEGSC